MKNSKEKVSREVAEQDFERFVDSMDIDADTSCMSTEDKESFNQQKEKILTAIQNGSLLIDESGTPTYTPIRTKDAEPITFNEPTGAALMAMDRRKKGEDIGKLYASMAEITGTNAKTFANMKMTDLKVCMAVTMLFLV